MKQAVPATYELKCQQEDGLDYPQMFSAVLESDPPNDKMDQNSWNGNFHSFVNRAGETSKLPIALGFTQLLLRGCRLRNTKWIIGQVAFTGQCFDSAEEKGERLCWMRTGRITVLCCCLFVSLSVLLVLMSAFSCVCCSFCLAFAFPFFV